MSPNALQTEPAGLTDEALAAAVQEFEETGYTVLKGVIPPPRVEELRAFLTERFTDPQTPNLTPQPSDLQIKMGVEVIGNTALSDLFVVCPETLDVFANPSVVAALKGILGEDFIMLPDSVAHWNCYNVLHADTTTAEQKGWMYHKDPGYRIVVVGLYLQDNLNGSGGGLYLVPNSHQQQDPLVELRNLLPKRISKREKSFWRRLLYRLSFKRLFNYEKAFLDAPGGFDLPTRAGDMIIFDMRMIHRSSFPGNKTLRNAGGKFSIFIHCSRNNAQSRQYIEYLRTKTLVDFLEVPRDTRAQDELAQKYGFTAL